MTGTTGPKGRHHVVSIQALTDLPQNTVKWSGALMVVRDNGAAVAATKVLTIAAGNASVDDTVTIDGVVYRFKSTMLAAYDVKISAVDNDATVANLVAAINASGTPGVEYFAGTLIHPTVAAGAETGDGTTAITAKVKGLRGNAIAVSESGANISWAGGATALSAGADDPVLAIGNSDGSGWDLYARTGTV